MQWQKQNWKRNFKDYRQERPKPLIVALETVMEQIFAMGVDQVRPRFEAMCQMFFKRFGTLTPLVHMEGRMESEEEQEQRKVSQQMVVPASGGYNEGLPARLVELDPARFRGANGESGGAGNFGAPNDRKKVSVSNSPRGEWRLMDEDGSL